MEMIQFTDLSKDNVLATIINGKLKEKDVELLHEKIHLILSNHDKVRWYFEMQDFEGWSVQGFWEDFKMDIVHKNDYEKIAMVGDKKWQKLITQLMEPFIKAVIRYFDLSDKEKAKTWILE